MFFDAIQSIDSVDGLQRKLHRETMQVGEKKETKLVQNQ